MRYSGFSIAGIVLAIAASVLVTIAQCDEPGKSDPEKVEPGKSEPGREKSARRGKPVEVEEKNRVPIDVARDRAKVLHEVYEVTLDVIHHKYFHRDRAIIPARAMEEIFKEIRHQSQVDARWISVNLKAMSIDHEPETEFEIQAAKELGKGKASYEGVSDGYYRRAGAIPLTAGCLTCHAGLFKDSSQTPKYAALVISIPIKGEATPAGQ